MLSEALALMMPRQPSLRRLNSMLSQVRHRVSTSSIFASTSSGACTQHSKVLKPRPTRDWYTGCTLVAGTLITIQTKSE